MAVRLTVWLAAVPFIRSPIHLVLSLSFYFGWLGVLYGVGKWKGEP